MSVLMFRVDASPSNVVSTTTRGLVLQKKGRKREVGRKKREGEKVGGGGRQDGGGGREDGRRGKRGWGRKEGRMGGEERGGEERMRRGWKGVIRLMEIRRGGWSGALHAQQRTKAEQWRQKHEHLSYLY